MHFKTLKTKIERSLKVLLSAAAAACILVRIPETEIMIHVSANEEYKEDDNSDLFEQPVITTETIEVEGTEYTITIIENSTQRSVAVYDGVSYDYCNYNLITNQMTINGVNVGAVTLDVLPNLPEAGSTAGVVLSSYYFSVPAWATYSVSVILSYLCGFVVYKAVSAAATMLNIVGGYYYGGKRLDFTVRNYRSFYPVLSNGKFKYWTYCAMKVTPGSTYSADVLVEYGY